MNWKKPPVGPPTHEYDGLLDDILPYGEEALTPSTPEEPYAAWHVYATRIPWSKQRRTLHEQHMAELMERIARLRASQHAMEREIRRLKEEWILVYQYAHHLKRNQWQVILRALEAATGERED